MAAMLHGRNNRFYFLWEKFSFLIHVYKIFSLFLPCNMAAVQNLNSHFSTGKAQIRPLHNLVTWYGINYAGMQVTQWDFQNKEM